MRDLVDQKQLQRYVLLADISAMVFVELPIFIRCADDLFSDEDLIELQNTLLENPDIGNLIQGARGLRELRVPLPGRGKRGGARVIYRHRQFDPRPVVNWGQISINSWTPKPSSTPPIIFFKAFASAVGTPAKLIEIAAQRKQRPLRGLAAAKKVFSSPNKPPAGV